MAGLQPQPAAVVTELPDSRHVNESNECVISAKFRLVGPPKQPTRMKDTLDILGSNQKPNGRLLASIAGQKWPHLEHIRHLESTRPQRRRRLVMEKVEHLTVSISCTSR